RARRIDDDPGERTRRRGRRQRGGDERSGGQDRPAIAVPNRRAGSARSGSGELFAGGAVALWDGGPDGGSERRGAGYLSKWSRESERSGERSANSRRSRTAVNGILYGAGRCNSQRESVQDAGAGNGSPGR